MIVAAKNRAFFYIASLYIHKNGCKFNLLKTADNSIHHILFASPLGVILLKVTLKDMKITDSRETPTKVHSVPSAGMGATW